jgi:photosystem I P700 chlorophyll a apoprotein A1
LVRSSNSYALINKLLDAGVAPQEIPLPHEFLINRELMSQLYPSFSKD